MGENEGEERRKIQARSCQLEETNIEKERKNRERKEEREERKEKKDNYCDGEKEKELPVGIQLVAGFNSDKLLLSVAKRLEDIINIHATRSHIPRSKADL